MDTTFLTSTLTELFAAVPLTLALFALSILFGGTLAITITWMRVSRNRAISSFAKAYIFLFRGSPLLIQIFLIYYGLAQFDLVRNGPLWPYLRQPFVCAVIALSLCTAGYTAEILRGGLRAVPVRDIEAAKSIGMSGLLLFRRIIAPIALRHILPSYTTEMVLMIKSTALASIVTVWEVTGVAQRISSETYRVFETFACAAIIYLMLNFIVIQAMALAEMQLSKHSRQISGVSIIGRRK